MTEKLWASFRGLEQHVVKAADSALFISGSAMRSARLQAFRQTHLSESHADEESSR